MIETTEGSGRKVAAVAVQTRRAPIASRWGGLLACAILVLAPPARAAFGAAGHDSLAVPTLSSPALSAFT